MIPVILISNRFVKLINSKLYFSDSNMISLSFFIIIIMNFKGEWGLVYNLICTLVSGSVLYGFYTFSNIWERSIKVEDNKYIKELIEELKENKSIKITSNKENKI